MIEIHQSGQKAGLATAIMEHASALVNLASALYVGQHYVEAEDAYGKALQV